MVSKAVAKVSLTAMMVTKNNDERMVKKSLQGFLYDVHLKHHKGRWITIFQVMFQLMLCL